MKAKIKQLGKFLRGRRYSRPPHPHVKGANTINVGQEVVLVRKVSACMALYALRFVAIKSRFDLSQG